MVFFLSQCTIFHILVLLLKLGKWRRGIDQVKQGYLFDFIFITRVSQYFHTFLFSWSCFSEVLVFAVYFKHFASHLLYLKINIFLSILFFILSSPFPLHSFYSFLSYSSFFCFDSTLIISASLSF